MTKSISIGNGAGFWGDRISASYDLIKHSQLDYLTLDYLSELSLAILAYQKKKDISGGYVSDFLSALDLIAPLLAKNPHLKIITNAGGLNPHECARQVAKILHRHRLDSYDIGVVNGDSVLNKKGKLLPFSSSSTCVPKDLIQANVYFGIGGIVDALNAGAQIIITGRVADISLTLAPCVFEFNWSMDSFDLLAQASVAGHLIECGAQVTGGLSHHYLELKKPYQLGYPIAVISEDGQVGITKPKHSGGCVTVETVTEQLLYEIGDPRAYITPDVVIDLSQLSIQLLHQDYVCVSGAKGLPPTNFYKVASSFHRGFHVSFDLVFNGFDSQLMAEHTSKIIKKQAHCLDLTHINFELLGSSPVTVLRSHAASLNKVDLKSFCQLFPPLITNGPAGVSGYTGKRPQPIPKFSFFPALIKKKQIQYSVTISPLSHFYVFGDYV